MKLAIIGSRGLSDINLEDYIRQMPDEIVSGGAKGIDTLAARYAKAHNIPLTEFLPDYKRFGRSAPIIRNRQIIEAADHILALWDGTSRGTKNAMDVARRLGKEVSLFVIDTSND